MSKKKVFWIVLFIVIVVAVIAVIIVAKPKDNEKEVSANSIITEKSDSTSEQKEKSTEPYIKTELEDGILYSKDGKKANVDMVIGDNYFDTTINDIYLNPEDYTNQNIEIEGMYLVSDPALPYTFVGRYSLSNLCPNCPSGYSVLEYQLDGTIDAKLTNEKDWIKIVGTLEKGVDDGGEYYYINAKTIEIMNEKGNDTVNN